MAWLNRLKNTLLRRDVIGQEADDEIAFHLEERTRENVARGMTPTDARREAQLRFGSRARLREETREADTLLWLEALTRDSRLALRGLVHRPGLALTAVLSLGLGIGATSAIFSVVDTVLLKPLPYPEPEQLVSIQESILGQALGGNPARLADWQRQLPALSGLVGLYGEGVVLTGRGEPRRLTVRRSIGPVFAVLGIAPRLGRPYAEWNESEVVLSHEFWQTHLGGDRSILGKTLNLSQKTYTVVGVMPPSSGEGPQADLFASANVSFNSPDRTGNWLDLVGRRQPGESLERLNTQLATVAARLSAQYPATESGLSARAIPLLDADTADARRPLWLLLATISAVLLVVCANIASLLLVRAGERQHEFAVRAALGAGWANLLRLQLLESLWLSLTGGGLGLLIAYWGVDLLKYILPPDLPRIETVSLDTRVASFALILALVAGLFCGLLASLGGNPLHLRDGARSTRRTWLRPAFVVVQVVLSTLLLAGAARFTESLIASIRTPLGFQAEGLLAMSYSFPWDTDQKKLNETYQATLDQLAAIPGVRGVGFVDQLPLRGGTQSGQVEVAGRELAPILRNLPISQRSISDAYFTTLGLPLLAGRMFRPHATGVMECVINATFAKLYFPGEDPVGRRITFDTKRQPGEAPRWLTITGVVTDLRQEPRQARAAAEAFMPFTRQYWPLAKFVVRGSGDPASLMAAVRQRMLAVDPNLPIEALRPLSDDLREAASDTRTLTGLLSGFALTALLVAAIGLYGLLAGEVTTRQREIGIRLALGAEPQAVLRSIIRRGMALVTVGLAVGLVLCYPALQLLTSQDSPMTAGALAAALMLMVAFVSSAIPGRRAARVDPAIALRHE